MVDDRANRAPPGEQRLPLAPDDEAGRQALPDSLINRFDRNTRYRSDLRRREKLYRGNRFSSNLSPAG
jgi:hypothetical protein